MKHTELSKATKHKQNQGGCQGRKAKTGCREINAAGLLIAISINRLPKEIRDVCRRNPTVQKNVLVEITRKKSRCTGRAEGEQSKAKMIGVFGRVIIRSNR
jgi:hypothetical protein